MARKGRAPWWWPHFAAAMGLLVDALAWGVAGAGITLGAAAFHGGVSAGFAWTAFLLSTLVGASQFWLRRRGLLEGR